MGKHPSLLLAILFLTTHQSVLAGVNVPENQNPLDIPGCYKDEGSKSIVTPDQVTLGVNCKFEGVAEALNDKDGAWEKSRPKWKEFGKGNPRLFKLCLNYIRRNTMCVSAIRDRVDKLLEATDIAEREGQLYTKPPNFTGRYHAPSSPLTNK